MVKERVRANLRGSPQLMVKPYAADVHMRLSQRESNHLMWDG
jgi:hypothetical protein